jgi:K+-transporting ATPase ATPase C chain
MLLLLTLITGVVYPLAVTMAARVAFPRQAEGSVILLNGKPVGSALIGQNFDDPKYFWGRLSATSPIPYTAFNADASAGSSGSNLGPLNPALIDPKTGTVQGRIDALADAEKTTGAAHNTSKPPVDLVTSSGSGLDPHISPASAEFQLLRVAKARDLNVDVVKKLVAEHTEPRQLGVLGEPRVNVLELNLALDAIKK